MDYMETDCAGLLLLIANLRNKKPSYPSTSVVAQVDPPLQLGCCRFGQPLIPLNVG